MKIRCKKCRDIIEGDKKGKFIQCSCKSCYIDETEHYCRLCGEFNDIEAVIDFTEYNDMLTDKQELTKYKERCEKAIDYIKNHRKVFSLGVNEEIDEFDYISTSPKALLEILGAKEKE